MTSAVIFGTLPNVCIFGEKAGPGLCECCGQDQVEVVSNSTNKIHQTWDSLLAFPPPPCYLPFLIVQTSYVDGAAQGKGEMSHPSRRWSCRRRRDDDPLHCLISRCSLRRARFGHSGFAFFLHVSCELNNCKQSI